MRGYKRHPIERHYYTEREKLEDRGPRQNDFPVPTLQEVIPSLGNPPIFEDLPDWLAGLEGKKQKLEGFYSQITHELLCDPEIPSAAKVVYCLYHKFCKVKDLSKKPTTFVGKNTIARHMGKTTRYITELIRVLEEKGWLEIIPRKGKTNKTILHGKPIRTRTQEL